MRSLTVLAGLLIVAGCAHFPLPSSRAPAASPAPAHTRSVDPRAHEIVMFSLGLMDTGYTFGGKNPEAGLDCSGMVSFVFENAAGLRLSGSAADIARHGRPVDTRTLRPGDLVFFNTLNRPRSHVGIYIGGGRFIHAPSSNGRVRTDSLKTGWFAARFEEARTYFD